MTCIVGLVDKGVVYMGADSLGVETKGLTKGVRKDVKVFINGNFLIGCTSSFRMIQLLQYKFVPPEHPNGIDDMRYMVVNVIDAIRRCFKDNDYTTGQFLMGYKGTLYEIDTDFQVGIDELNYGSVGCGAAFAMGALFANGKMKPEDRITNALQAATQFSAGVAPPFVILKK